MSSYDRMVASYDFLKSGDTRRWRYPQTNFFKGLYGRVLYVGIGTGQEILHFPQASPGPGLKDQSGQFSSFNGTAESHLELSKGITDLTAIDVSLEMIKRAEGRTRNYPGTFHRMLMNVERLGFQDESFDCVLAVCVFCTVNNPVKGFREVNRVLKAGGKIFAFEHVLSRNPIYAAILKMMTQITQLFYGTHLDRDTIGNMEEAGLLIESVQNHYLDIVKAIVASKRL